MPVDLFAEPFFILVDKGLIPTDKATFCMTRNFYPANRHLRANVRRLSGRAGLEWVLDYDGNFFEVTSLGLIPKTLLQKLCLTRQKEEMRIEEPRSITIGEFKSRIAKVKNPYPEAPVTAYIRKLLKKYPDDLIMDRVVMTVLMGESID